MDFSDFDMDKILDNDSKYTNNAKANYDNKYENKYNTTDETELNETQEYLSQYNLIFFTDGSCLGNGKQDSRNKAGFGIYIISTKFFFV